MSQAESTYRFRGPTPGPTAPFLMRMPPDLRAQLEPIAEAEGRSLSNLIVYALHQWLEVRAHAN